MSSRPTISTPPRPPVPPPARLVAVVALSILLCELVFLAGAYVQGFFLVDAQGHGIASDFVNVWAAGGLALEGRPAAPYEWTILRPAQEAAVGGPFEGEYRWHYPPPFLFAAALAATLPYVPAWIAWLAATGAAYAAVLRGILGERLGVLFGLGFPGAAWNVTAGQNGFLTAALVGGAIAALERHPLVAGACLGLLTYKPQFGLLFPLVLVATGNGRAFAAAAVAGTALALVSWLAFGSAAWLAFFHSLSSANQLVLADGAIGWNKLQSMFGLVRWLGGGASLAWLAQGLLVSSLCVALVVLWRSRAPFDLKAAALGIAVVLATPYLFVYDLVVLAVPTAFLLRLALATGFARIEAIGLAAAALLLLSYVLLPLQVGLAAALVLAGLIARRAAASFAGAGTTRNG